MVKPGAAVLDVGITRTEAGLVGDVAADVASVAGWVAPNPGGVGPMTRAMLLANVVETAERRLSPGGTSRRGSDGKDGHRIGPAQRDGRGGPWCY
jgi:hypothetical protein